MSHTEPRPVRALIFDFDGLIIDTEVPAFQAWQEVYEAHGQTLTLEVWSRALGASLKEFDAALYLQEIVGRSLDLPALRTARLNRKLELLAAQDALPGVRDWVEEAASLGIRLAVATSSLHGWPESHLERTGLLGSFDTIVCADDVHAAKPDPALFLEALRRLAVDASEAIAIEDSPNGIRSAQAAGIVCIAVPNELTRQLGVDHADLVLQSLASMSLRETLASIGRVPPMIISENRTATAPR